jgi:hypothetical protein
MSNIEGADVSLTLQEFCKAEKICLASYYKMKKRGYAPVEIRVPGTKIIRITPEARRQWHAMLAALAQSDAVKLEKERAREASVAAGKAAAASPRHVNARRRARSGRGT